MCAKPRHVQYRASLPRASIWVPVGVSGQVGQSDESSLCVWAPDGTRVQQNGLHDDRCVAAWEEQATLVTPTPATHHKPEGFH